MPALSHRRFRAPQEDGAAFIDPPLSEAAKLIEHNRAVTAAFDDRGDFPAHYRDRARFWLDGGKTDRLSPRILSGHQPELFHPGVWLKNFVLSAIAKAVDGTGVNLVIDSDEARAISVRVPTLVDGAAAVVAVPCDDPGDCVPWERRLIASWNTFEEFAGRAGRMYAAVRGGDTRELLLDNLWPRVRAAAELHRHAFKDWINSSFGTANSEVREKAMRIPAPCNLGACMVAGRQELESSLGLVTSETFVSDLDPPFQLFADHLLRRQREFREIHNDVLDQYRTAYGIHSKNHPVPDLAVVDDWIESPLWMWSRSNARRRRVFVRPFGLTCQISDLEGFTEVMNRTHTGFGFDSGIMLRPRALITTMYARLVLSDLFIHGIGGAKYDEVTDEIIRRFFGIEPPKYITATATFRLPIERPHVAIEDVRDVRQKLRDVRYRPESFLRDPLTQGVARLREQLQALADEKRELVRTQRLRRCEEQVFARLDTINRAMHALLEPVERELFAQQAQLNEDLRRADLLGSREFSFVLFPSDELPARLLALSKVSA